MTNRLLVGLALTMVAAGWLPVSAQEQMGSWYYSASIDPITDVNTSSAFTVDDDEEWALGINCRDGGYVAGVMIHPNSTNGALLRLKAIMETWKREMTWRTDQNDPVTERWLVTEAGLGLRDDRAAWFTQELMLATDRVVLRFGHSAATYTVILSADGAAEAIAALNGCN